MNSPLRSLPSITFYKTAPGMQDGMSYIKNRETVENMRLITRHDEPHHSELPSIFSFF